MLRGVGTTRHGGRDTHDTPLLHNLLFRSSCRDLQPEHEPTLNPVPTFAASSNAAGYSSEITTYLGGWGMEGMLTNRKPVLSGIVNGIDNEE